MTHDEMELQKVKFVLKHAKTINTNVEFTPEQAQLMLNEYHRLEGVINELYGEFSNIYVNACRYNVSWCRRVAGRVLGVELTNRE